MVSGLHVKTESVQSFCNSVFAFPYFLWSPRSLTLLHVFLELLPELVNERIGFLHKFFEDILQFLSSNRDIAPVRALDVERMSNSGVMADDCKMALAHTSLKY